MTAPPHIFGIRHHGPGSARTLLAALDELRPSTLLIECPADAYSAVEWIANEDLTPPVAMLIHDVDAPANAVYYPLAEYSPEWQAMRWAAVHGATIQFMDLPHAQRPIDAVDDGANDTERDVPLDPLDVLAFAGGYDDGERWWDAVIEHRRQRDSAIRAFEVIAEAMVEIRTAIEAEYCEKAESDRANERTNDRPSDVTMQTRSRIERITLNELREAHMRQTIRAAMRGSDGPVAVVCGAWHVPALWADHAYHERSRDADMPGTRSARADSALLKSLPRRKTAVVWVPWTSSRLTHESGYGAGVRAPGWYAHLWKHDEAIAERWIARISHALRGEGLDASPAHAVAAAHLGQTLASLRGRALPTLDDLSDAAEAVHAHGGEACMALIHARVFIGDDFGHVPDDAPTTPLAADLARLQKLLRLKPSPAESTLELDLRKELDLSRSILLHRLSLLGLSWGVPAEAQRGNTGTFRETWTLTWHPEFVVRIIELSPYGNTIEAASAAYIDEFISRSHQVQVVASSISTSLAADLRCAVEAALKRLDDLAAATDDVGTLMDAMPGLASAIRYGDVRKTDTSMLASVARSMLVRIMAGLPAATLSLDDDAARLMSNRIDATHAALATITAAAPPLVNNQWLDTLTALAESDTSHGLISGRAARHLHDAGDDEHQAPRRLGAALSFGADVPRAAAWIDGFLAGSALVLLHDARLWRVIDDWVASIANDRFDAILPVLRRTFSRFPPPERFQIGERILSAGTAPENIPSRDDDDLHHDRAARAIATVNFILGRKPSP